VVIKHPLCSYLPKRPEREEEKKTSFLVNKRNASEKVKEPTTLLVWWVFKAFTESLSLW
jgi:hypothetical protein